MNPVLNASLLVLLLSGAAVGQTTTRESVASGGQEAAGWSSEVSMSADGRLLAFSSSASNLVPNDTNGQNDVFVRDRVAGTTIRASVAATGAENPYLSGTPAISADGRLVAFVSQSTLLIPGLPVENAVKVYVKDLLTGTVDLVSRGLGGLPANGHSARPALSADGRFVVFSSTATNLVLSDTNNAGDVFVFDRITQQTVRVSIDAFGVELPHGLPVARSSISATGRYIAFESAEDLLPGPSVTPVVRLWDLQFGLTVVVSAIPGTGAIQDGLYPVVAADGSAVAFQHGSGTLLPGDLNGVPDVFVYDVPTGTLSLVSVDTSGSQGNSSSVPTSVSADGRYVAFTTASALEASDTNGVEDVYVRDRKAGVTHRVSLGDTGQEGTKTSFDGRLSADGTVVGFCSWASNLVPGDTNQAYDVFLRERCGTAVAAGYGAGLPGTGGVVPALSLSGPPVLGAVVTLSLGNPSGVTAPALLLLGAAPAAAPTPWGGTLLVTPSAVLAFSMPAAGLAVPVILPAWSPSCPQAVFLQMLLLDAGAVLGVAFSPGLQATPGI